MDSKAKKQWFAGLTRTMPLTPLDFTAPQNYIMNSWGFRFSARLKDKHTAVAHLISRLRDAFAQLPFLGGQIIHAQHGEGRLSNLDVCPDEVFDYQALDPTVFPWTFDELLALGVFAASMTKHLLWLLPMTDPAPGDVLHPVTLRASFFPGGLILGFAFHHGVMDGTATTEFLNYFTGAVNTTPAHSLPLRKQTFTQYAAATASSVDDPRTVPGYDFTTPPTPPPTLPPAIAKVFSISAARATALHTAAISHIRSSLGDSSAFVSITDTLCALVWLHITRARLHARRIDVHDTTRFATAVNIRSRLPARVIGSTTAAGYIGNMWLRALAECSVRELVVDASLSMPATTQQIARAARVIKAAEGELVEQATMERHIGVAAGNAAAAASAAARGDLKIKREEEMMEITPADVDAAVRRVIARHTTGVDASVQVMLGADVEFDIPGMVGGKGKASWVRRAYMPNDGAVGVLPRRGGTRGDADWQVWLALREEDMAVLESEGELGGWLSRPAA